MSIRSRTLTRRDWLAAASATVALPRSLLSAAPPGEKAPAKAAHVDWLAQVQQPPARPAPDAPRLSPLLVDSAGKPITDLPGWERRRDELDRAWRKFLGVLPPAAGPPKPKVQASERLEGGVVRELVAYETEKGEECLAYLIRPEKPAGRCPGVVCLHSTVDFSLRQPAGLEGEPTLYFGLELARRGCVTISPRNFLWTAASGKLAAQAQVDAFRKRQPGSLGMARMLFDAQRAVDVLAARDDVDPLRLGCVGHSLGAKEVLYLAAFDERIVCAVSSEGGVGLSFSNWDADWYLGPAIREKSFPREHHELLALCAPRAMLVVGGDSADGDKSWPYLAAALPVYELYGKPAPLGLLNHRAGHKLPPAAHDRVQQWLASYLKWEGRG